MKHQGNSDEEIIQLKIKLEKIAQKHRYNFMHPKVVEISQRLDQLIVSVMKRKEAPHPDLHEMRSFF